jgi:MFS transporter, DHA1 family, multidrug resistance protein
VLVMVITSAIFLALHAITPISLWMFLIFATILFFCFGLIFGNLNAIAMEPMGHVAGIAAAIIGSVSSIISMCIGTAIGQMYNNTLIPITTGFLVLSLLSLIIMRFADKTTNTPEPELEKV